MHELIKAEYQGVDFTFRDDGWFNATAAAKRYGKETHDWIRSPETERYIAALERTYGKIPYVKTSRARTDRGGGTWLHPKLAVGFTRWLDVDFSVWADAKIDAILRGDAAPEDAQELSTMRDRLPLHYAAAEIVQRHHVSFPVAHMANNAAAGSKNYKSMTKDQVIAAVPVAKRIANGTATPKDFALLESGKRALAGEQAQIEIDLANPPDGVE
ncbi:MAG: KilA-N domain-containing protein [Pseudomonadota bacterium]